MKNYRILLLTFLLVSPFISIFYKVFVEKISFLPQTSSRQWNVEVVYDLKSLLEESDGNVITLPMISSWHNQKVDIKEVISPYDYSMSPGYGTSNIVILRSKIEEQSKAGKISVFASFTKKEIKKGTQVRTRSSSDKAELKRKYLDRRMIEDSTMELLKDLSAKIIDPKDDSFERVRKIYYYITEEILTNSSVETIDEALSLGEGSEWIRSLIFVQLARLNNIPARINLAFIYTIPSVKTQMAPLKKSYFPEVLIGDYWYPVDTVNNTFLRVPLRHFIVYQDAEVVRKSFKNKHIYLNLAPIMVNKVDSTVYRNKLASVNSFLSYISLHSLPLTQQAAFYIVLLIPVGTLVLSIARNMIGVSSFGVFTPILLSLFFVETSFMLGMIFFTVIVLLGFAQRYLLDKFYLLAVPRLSIQLTLVILCYMFFTLIYYQNFYTAAVGGTLGYFPIVIITSFIERFSVNFIEEGMRSTLKTLVGTFFISILCYLIFDNETLQLTLFNHPELLLTVIGLNFIVGSYKGYRLSEILRFKELTEVS